MSANDDPIDTESMQAARRVDDLCDRFEIMWQKGVGLSIEDFLRGVALDPLNADAELMRELVRLESEYRLQAGEQPTGQEYQRRFPHFLPHSANDPDKVSKATSRETGDPPGFEILQELGRGGMGIVYKAREIALDRVVALKMVVNPDLAGPREVERLRFEAEAAARLDHSNIVPVYAVGQNQGRAFFSMKLIEGGSLRERRSDLQRSPREAARLLAKVARAVHHAHERGVIHRDLKPGNILIDAHGEPHVADFGLAKRTDMENSLSFSGAVAGTASYMAPEQARGDRGLTTAIDVYALGAVLFECLTGWPPFRGDSVVNVLQQVIRDQPPDPRSLAVNADPSLGAVCLKCLEKQPSDRYPSAAALAEDLERYLHGESLSVQMPGTWEWLRQAMRMRPAPSPHFKPVELIWLGPITLLTHALIFVTAAADWPMPLIWGILAASIAAIVAVFWFHKGARFRSLPIIERETLMSAVGHLIAICLLYVTFVPFDAEASARGVLAWYPPLAVVSGLSLFAIGVIHWGRFYLIGLGMMALAPVMAWMPLASPMIYGITFSACLLWWAIALRKNFVPQDGVSAGVQELATGQRATLTPNPPPAISPTCSLQKD